MESSAIRRETILVVEDEAPVLELIAGVLRNEGYPVLAAGNGEEAFRICSQHEGIIDLILTDIVMPKISGGELVRQIRPHRPNIKVLYMSGYTRYTTAARGALESVETFIWKPFTPAELLLKVREVLDGPQTPR